MPRQTEQTEQAGVLLVFKPGVDAEQAQAALEQLRELLEYQPRVSTFNPEWGYPCFYIP